MFVRLMTTLSLIQLAALLASLDLLKSSRQYEIEEILFKNFAVNQITPRSPGRFAMTHHQMIIMKLKSTWRSSIGMHSTWLFRNVCQTGALEGRHFDVWHCALQYIQLYAIMICRSQIICRSPDECSPRMFGLFTFAFQSVSKRLEDLKFARPHTAAQTNPHIRTHRFVVKQKNFIFVKREQSLRPAYRAPFSSSHSERLTLNISF